MAVRSVLLSTIDLLIEFLQLGLGLAKRLAQFAKLARRQLAFLDPLVQPPSGASHAIDVTQKLLSHGQWRRLLALGASS
jgi:hypothetical protein